MKVFICLTTVLAAASAAPQYFARPAGQVSHQSVSKPYQGEHRSTVQSKAFGAGVAVVSDSPNRLHGARGVIAHPAAFGHPVAHAIAHPFAHAIAHPVAHAIAHPVAHAIAHPAYAPTLAVAHPIAVAHAPGYAAPDLAEVSPYSFNYAVADDYSNAAFNQAESNDGNGVVQGSYSVNLPDGRVQTVNYSANDYDGLVAEVSYEGTAAYPETVAHPAAYAPRVAHAPVIAHAPFIAHAPLVAHAPIVAHPVSPLAHGIAVSHLG